MAGHANLVISFLDLCLTGTVGDSKDLYSSLTMVLIGHMCEHTIEVNLINVVHCN
jgi:hypothetical protein